jgi:glycosyltransferase involved in cell wall biosynthesis
MRIGWYSNGPHIPSGYGQQTAQVVSRMAKDGHEVAVVSNHGAQVAMNWQNIPIFPDGLKQYSVDIFGQHLKNWGGVSVGLFDSWPLMPMAEQLRELNLAWWVPIDHDPVPSQIVEFFSKSGAVAIGMTKFGEQQLLKAGMPREMVRYIPHAIDTKEMFVDTGKTARAQMQIPEGAHLTVVCAANRGRIPVRKAFGENLLALSNHLKRHPDAWAYIHTEPLGLSDGMNLPRYLQFIDAPMERIRWPEPIAFRNGIPNEALRMIYSAADVLLATSMGEGFGVPTIEAQACGTPTILSDFAGSGELAGPHCKLIGGQRSWDEFQGSYWIVPNVLEIEEALDVNRTATKAGKVDRIAVRQHAQQYDADLVYAEKWRPLIGWMEKRPAPGAPANREQRRAAKKKR